MGTIISDGFSVAHHHMHEAFIHLGEAYTVNTQASKEYLQIESNLTWHQCLTIAPQIRDQFTKENKKAIKAIVLFQAGMEAWISWAYTRPPLDSVRKPKSFKDKWEEAFDNCNIQHDFSVYGNFYKNYRNPVVHPSNPVDIESIDQIWVKPVYQGIQAGWKAMEALSPAIGFSFDSNSWETMCKINNVPNVFSTSDTLDLVKISLDLYKRAKEGAEGKNIPN